MPPDVFSIAIADHALGDDQRRAADRPETRRGGILFAATTPRLDFTQLSFSGRRELHVLRCARPSSLSGCASSSASTVSDPGRT